MNPILCSILFGVCMQASLLLLSCKKDRGCYDEILYQENKNARCTMDCPGVTGCEGKTYFNECIPRRQGIAVGK